MLSQRIACFLLSLVFLTACGQKGSLYLPESTEGEALKNSQEELQAKDDLASDEISQDK